MISVDDFLKIILVISIAFAIVGIAFQIMRLLSKATSIMEEPKKPITNISTLSDYLIEDYSDVRKYIKSAGSVITGAGEIVSSINFFKFFKRKKKEKKSSE